MQVVKKIQSSWEEYKLIGIDSIVFNNGSVLSIDITKTIKTEALNTYGKLYRLNINEKKKLSELLEEDDDLWSEIQINGEFELKDKSRVVFGEGEMGNDGFIVNIDSNNQIVWSFYSTESNPFVKCNIINDKVHIFSSHGFSIVIDKSNPSKSYIDNHFEESC
jgi:hypothetical protein